MKKKKKSKRSENTSWFSQSLQMICDKLFCFEMKKKMEVHFCLQESENRTVEGSKEYNSFSFRAIHSLGSKRTIVRGLEVEIIDIQAQQ